MQRFLLWCCFGQISLSCPRQTPVAQLWWKMISNLKDSTSWPSPQESDCCSWGDALKTSSTVERQMANLVRENEPTRPQNQLLMGELQPLWNQSHSPQFADGRLSQANLPLHSGDDHNSSSLVYPTNTNDLQQSAIEVPHLPVPSTVPFYFVATW